MPNTKEIDIVIPAYNAGYTIDKMFGTPTLPSGYDEEEF